MVIYDRFTIFLCQDSSHLYFPLFKFFSIFVLENTARAENLFPFTELFSSDGTNLFVDEKSREISKNKASYLFSRTQQEYHYNHAGKSFPTSYIHVLKLKFKKVRMMILRIFCSQLKSDDFAENLQFFVGKKQLSWKW